MAIEKASSNWKSPKPELLPDFIIGGAMKSGTTTLHHILNTHPDVFIPRGELHFFDMDNLLQHSDFNFFIDGKWVYQSMDADSDKMWNWYQDKFSKHASSLKGEDSTTYIASPMAARRIALQEKEIKLIFLLRQPTLRAYSQYFHNLGSGRAVHTFEETIQYAPDQVLRRSLYREQLEPYFKQIPYERIKVILFEDLISQTKETLREICSFLEIDFSLFSEETFNTHSNRARRPRDIGYQIRKNKMLRSYGNVRYADHLPFKPAKTPHRNSFWENMIYRIHGKLNPLTSEAPPKINLNTKAFLDQYFKRELQGLDELMGKEILSRWFD